MRVVSISTTPPNSTAQPRILLCASAAHCAKVLRAAAQAQVSLHGLQPSTIWPTPTTETVLWALLPADAPANALHIEQQWRQQLTSAATGFAIQMLLGSAAQQAQQLAPWVSCDARRAGHARANAEPCWECLDPASERQLFQHLLQR